MGGRGEGGTRKLGSEERNLLDRKWFLFYCDFLYFLNMLGSPRGVERSSGSNDAFILLEELFKTNGASRLTIHNLFFRTPLSGLIDHQFLNRIYRHFPKSFEAEPNTRHSIAQLLALDGKGMAPFRLSVKRKNETSDKVVVDFELESLDALIDLLLQKFDINRDSIKSFKGIESDDFKLSLIRWLLPYQYDSFISPFQKALMKRLFEKDSTEIARTDESSIFAFNEALNRLNDAGPGFSLTNDGRNASLKFHEKNPNHALRSWLKVFTGLRPQGYNPWLWDALLKSFPGAFIDSPSSGSVPELAGPFKIVRAHGRDMLRCDNDVLNNLPRHLASYFSFNLSVEGSSWIDRNDDLEELATALEGIGKHTEQRVLCYFATKSVLDVERAARDLSLQNEIVVDLYKKFSKLHVNHFLPTQEGFPGTSAADEGEKHGRVISQIDTFVRRNVHAVLEDLSGNFSRVLILAVKGLIHQVKSEDKEYEKDAINNLALADLKNVIGLLKLTGGNIRNFRAEVEGVVMKNKDDGIEETTRGDIVELLDELWKGTKKDTAEDLIFNNLPRNLKSKDNEENLRVLIRQDLSRVLSTHYIERGIASSALGIGARIVEPNARRYTSEFLAGQNPRKPHARITQ